MAWFSLIDYSLALDFQSRGKIRRFQSPHIRGKVVKFAGLKPE
jgi:hypothetical protein